MSQATQTEAVREDGTITGVSGPVVTAVGLEARMNDVVYVGDEGLMGEVIEIEGDETTIQVYEETSGVGPGEPVENTGNPLTVDLGPGMLDSIYDGVQRPLDVLETIMGSFLDRGVDAPGIDLEKEWEFTPTVEVGDEVGPGDVVGTVPETESIDHKVMVPPTFDEGIVAEVNDGAYTVDDPVVVLESGEEITMRQEWPVRRARPTADKHSPTVPLVTGQRIQDGLFPIAKGGTAAIPGPFGSGKCVSPETPVMMASGETLPIEELFESFAGEDTDAEGETLVEADAEVLTFDPSEGKIRPTSISHVYRGTTDRLLCVQTASGREFEVTPAHKLFKMTGDLRVEETPAAALQPGDSLVMPRRLDITGGRQTIDVYELLPEARAMDPEVMEPINEAIDEHPETKTAIGEAIGTPKHTMNNFTMGHNKPTLGFIEAICEYLGIERPQVQLVKPGTNGSPVRVPSHVNEPLSEFLGLVVSDGSVTDRVVRFHNNDDALRERFSKLANILFDCETNETVHNTVKTSTINSRVLSELLHGLGVPRDSKARTATVPDLIKQADDEVVAAFLRGVYLGDGSFSRGTVEIGTSSETLASDLSYLFARLGVLFRIRHRDDVDAYRLSVSSADELAKLHRAIKGTVDHPKIESMGAYARETTSNTNIDTVPVGQELMAEIAEAARYTDFEGAGLEITNYTGLGQQPSKEAFQAIENVVTDGGATVAKRVARTRSMMKDVFFDPIVDIEVIGDEQTVYDVTVPGTENFVGGSIPSVLHNTVTQQSLAKFADADIVVYIGCGERGNEMTEVIEDFPELPDPQTGNPLMSRTCLIANTSNMPVAARESCVYTGITIAEYYRDMGYDVALMADSTSRWAEAMREISSRLEEMPGEEGYPAYLAARLSQFYERAGLFTLLNGKQGSISVVGAVSPPGGDFSEPVTQNTLRIVKTFWALDSDLAERRHFPAINWDESYSLYKSQLDPWFVENVAEDYPELRQWAVDILDEEGELQEIVQLVGKDALPEDQQLTLEVARFVREAWLQQNALHDVDRYCPPEKTYAILQAIQTYHDEAFAALDAGVPVEDIRDASAPPRLNRIGTTEDYEPFIEKLIDDMTEELRGLY